MKVYSTQIRKQLFNDAPFQWFLREQATHNNGYTLESLEEEDLKLEAFIDAITIEVKADPAIQINIKDVGSVFIFSVIALRLGRADIMQQVLESVADCDEKAQELYLALSWQAPRDAQVLQIMEHGNPYTKQALVAAFPSNMEKQLMQFWLSSADKPVILKLLNYIGKNRLADYQPYADQYYDSEDKEISFAAAQSGLLLGDTRALRVIKKYANLNHPNLRTALLWLFSFADEKALAPVIDNVLKMQFSPRIQALCIAYSGFHEYIPQLLSIMQDINVAQVAAEAFSLITGVDIVDLNFDANAPEGDEPNAAQKCTLDDQYRRYEEDLPWPDTELIERWWAQNESQFDQGERYLAGKIINEKNLHVLLQTGGQSQRSVAALHLAKLKPQNQYFLTSNKTILQRQELNVL